MHCLPDHKLDMSHFRCLKSDSFDVWVKRDLLNGYEESDFDFYGKSPTDVVKVVSIYTNHVVAVLCPTRFHEEE